MTILHTLMNYGRLTGSELYVYELAREQSKKHQVVIQSNISEGKLVDRTKRLGIKVIDFTTKCDPDIIHSHQVNPTLFAKKVYSVPIVQTVHSEILPAYEYPIDGVFHISIRPSVSAFIHKCGFNSELVYNPIDTNRFNTGGLSDSKNVVLFVGSVDSLRSKAIKELVEHHNNKEIELVGVGNGWTFNCKSYKPFFHIENIVKECSYTAGIQIGRTTIEGWMCGKPAIIYDVNSDGRIKDKKIVEPPEDLSMFDSRLVSEKIEGIYKKCL